MGTVLRWPGASLTSIAFGETSNPFGAASASLPENGASRRFASSTEPGLVASAVLRTKLEIAQPKLSTCCRTISTPESRGHWSDVGLGCLATSSITRSPSTTTPSNAAKTARLTPPASRTMS